MPLGRCSVRRMFWKIQDIERESYAIVLMIMWGLFIQNILIGVLNIVDPCRQALRAEVEMARKNPGNVPQGAILLNRDD